MFRSLLYESLLVDSRKLIGWVSHEDAGIFGVFDDQKLVRDITPQLLKAFGVVLSPRKGLQLDIELAWRLQRAVHPLDMAVGPRGHFDYDLAYPHHFKRFSDAFGWSSDVQGQSNFALFIEGSRIHDLSGCGFKTALVEITAFYTDEFRLIGNQNVILANIKPTHRSRLRTILE